MNGAHKTLIRITLISLIILIWAGGCASVARDEQEGGIAGTGNAINCQEEENKHASSCTQWQ